MRLFIVENDYCGGLVIEHPEYAIEAVVEEIKNVEDGDGVKYPREILKARSVAGMRVGSERSFVGGYVKVKCIKRSQKWIDNLPEGSC